jgi:hypothetical protein
MKISKKTQLSIVILIPIFNVIASTTQDYFNGIGTGDIRMLIILLFLLFAFHKFYRFTLINTIIIINLLYLFVIALFATDLAYTFKVYSKYAVSTLMFIIGYHYIRELTHYKKLLKTYMVVLFIISFSIIIANIFSLGTSDYSDATIYYGAGRVNITMQMTILLLISPLVFLFIKKKKSKFIIIVLLLISLVFIVLGIKRTALATLVFGFTLYLYLSPTNIKIISKYIGLIITLLLFSPLYISTLISRFTARQESGRFDINQAPTEEARFMEVSRVINEYFDGDIGHKLFGSELFNYMEFGNTTRMLHTDYATFFSGSGLIGLFLFILIYIVILKKIFFYRRIFIKNKIMNSITAVCLVLIPTLFIYSAGGTVHSIGSRALIFLFLGASLGVLNQYYIEIQKKEKLNEING